MNYFDIYTAVIRNEHVETKDVIKVYVHCCDLYNDLVIMGEPYNSAAEMTRTIRDEARKYLDNKRG